MELDIAKSTALNAKPDFLEKAKTKVSGRSTFVCPKCGNGSGSTGDGICFVPGTENHPHYKCFACDLYADNIELWMLYTKSDNYKQALKGLIDHYGITVDDEDNPSKTKAIPTMPAVTEARSVSTNVTAPDEKYDYFIKAHENVGSTDYYEKRGLTQLTIDRFNLGYDPNWKHPDRPGSIPSARAIIPIADRTYLARAVVDKGSYDKIKVQGEIKTALIFNASALETADKPILIVEGEIDAMSVIQEGGEAIGLGSISNSNRLVELLKNHKPNVPMIISLDNESDPIKQQRVAQAADKLYQGISALGIKVIKADPATLAGKYKDANEHLVNDKEAFKMAVKELTDQAAIDKKVASDTNIEDNISTDIAEVQESVDTSSAIVPDKDKKANITKFISASDVASKLFEDFESGKVEELIPTGFEMLDDKLGGGLPPVLIVIGATSSLGKTTFVLQIADQIAAQGKKVLIFSFEMSAKELISKSISRIVAVSTNNTVQIASSDMLYKGAKDLSTDETEQCRKAYEEYLKIGKNISIIESDSNMNVKLIKNKIDDYIKQTGQKPVVFIDYLQIIPPIINNMGDKQNMDQIVSELKGITHDFRIPIMCISSFNRDSYNAPVSMKSFKESGGIEYSTDILLGMQLTGVATKKVDLNEAMIANPRQIDLLILKNRMYALSNGIRLKFHTKSNYFE